MKINEFVKFIEDKYTLYNKESWDNTGIILLPKNHNINSIIFSLSMTKKTLETAIKKKCNLIVTHHPLQLKTTNDYYNKKRTEFFIKKLINEGIGYYVMHTNFDYNEFGLNYWLAKLLNLNNIKPLKIISNKFKNIKTINLHIILKYFFNNKKNKKNIELGKTGYLKEKTRFSIFIKNIKNIFKLKKIVTTNINKNKYIEKISICGGSGKHLIYEAMNKSDCYLTSDLSYHDFEIAEFNKFPIIELNHYNIEVFGFKKWWQIYKNHFNLKTYFLENEGNYQEEI